MLQKKAKKNNQNWPQFPEHPYRILKKKEAEKRYFRHKSTFLGGRNGS